MKILRSIFRFIFINLIFALLISGIHFLFFVVLSLFKVLWIALKLLVKFSLNTLYYLSRMIAWPFKNCFPPKSIDQLSGLEFETFCTKWLALEGYRSIIKTPASSDYGVDILTQKDNQRIGIQCKRYSGNVGVGAIQEITAGMPYYECDKGLVITNSKFTQNAIDLAEANNIELIDGNILLDSRSCKTLTQNRFSMKVSLVIMFFLILLTLYFVFHCFIVARAYLPLALMFFGVCLLTFINGYLELNDRNKSDSEEAPFDFNEINSEEEIFDSE